MASPDQNRASLSGGRLSYGCSNLSLAWPHGGTGLGQVGEVYFEPPASYKMLPAEEDNITQKILYMGGDAVLGARVRGWHPDTADAVLSSIFPNVTDVSGKMRIDFPGSGIVAGEEMPALTPLVFTPNRPEDHPAIILYKAIVLLEESARLALSTMRWLAVPLVVVGIPDGSGRVAVMGPLASLSL